MKKKVILSSFFVFLMFLSISNGLAQEELIIRELQVGDIFAYQESGTDRIIQYEIAVESGTSSPGRYKLSQIWDVIANGNDSALIGGFPLRQELMFPEEYGLSFELAGDHFNANYSFADGVFLLSATEDRLLSLDVDGYPAVLLPNTTLFLNHAVKNRPVTPNSQLTDNLQYQIHTNQTFPIDEEVYGWYQLNLTVDFENLIEISGQWNSPFGNQRINGTQTFTFLDGNLSYVQSTCEYVGSCVRDVFINRTDFSAYKGRINAVIDRSTGIPDLIEFENQRGFDINTTLRGLASTRMKVDQSWRDPVSYSLVYTNIEPITFPITTNVYTTTIGTSTITYSEIIDNMGNTTTLGIGLFLIVIPIMSVLAFRLKKRV